MMNGLRIAVVTLCTGTAGYSMLAPKPAHAQIPRGTCMVSDPTGTPLNVRRFPNGPIVSRVRNGQLVVVRGIERDDRGRPWALLFSNDGASIGYVFREYVSCRN